MLADQDHVFFEYQPKHTSAAVCEMFRGFKGYIQADAHCVYDALYRGDARVSPEDNPPRGSRVLEPREAPVLGGRHRREASRRPRGHAPHPQALRS